MITQIEEIDHMVAALNNKKKIMSFEYNFILKSESQENLLDGIIDEMTRAKFQFEIEKLHDALIIKNPDRLSKWTEVASISQKFETIFLSTTLEKRQRDIIINSISKALEKKSVLFEIEEE